MKISLACFVFISAMLLSCSPQNDLLRSQLGSYRDYVSIKGSIENGAYISNNQQFSFLFSVPSLVRPGAEISDYYNKNGGGISFSDDIGTLVRLDFINKHAYFKGSMTNEDIIKIMDYFMYKEFYEPTKMHIKMITKSIIDNKLFVVFDFPHGSTLSSNNQRLNAIRGSLCFIKNDVVFMLTRQSTEMSSRSTAYNNIEAIKGALFRDYKSFTYITDKEGEY